jgi:hypothetical protein
VDLTRHNACNIRAISLKTGRFLGAFAETRRDFGSFPEKFFFTLSVFTRGKMGEIRPPACTVLVLSSVDCCVDDEAR